MNTLDPLITEINGRMYKGITYITKTDETIRLRKERIFLLSIRREAQLCIVYGNSFNVWSMQQSIKSRIDHIFSMLCVPDVVTWTVKCPIAKHTNPMGIRREIVSKMFKEHKANLRNKPKTTSEQFIETISVNDN